MRSRVLLIFLSLLLAAGMLGCQTANRFAWWKHDRAPDDSSRLARSAETATGPSSAPVLPSSEATPETVTASRQDKSKTPTYMASATAMPPSAKSVPATSAETIFNAPTANYAATAPPVAAGMSAAPTSPTTPAPPAAPPSALAQTSPYDPNAYQGTPATVATSAPSTQEYLDENRYGESMPSHYDVTPMASSAEAQARVAANAAADRYGYETPSSPPPASSVRATPAAQPDRYGMASAPAASSPPVQKAAPPPAVSMASAVTQPAPPATAPATATIATSSELATVQLTSPPGQYRPGGTSSYQPYAPPAQTEIASRAPSTPAPSVPPAATAPAPGASTPPPAYPAAPAPSSSGLRAY